LLATWAIICDWMRRGLNDPTSVFTFFLFVATCTLAIATLRLVKSAERTARRQLRAYIGVGSNDFAFETLGESDPNYAPIDNTNPVVGQVFQDFLTVTVTNFGKTPAYDVIVFGNVSGVPFSQRLNDNFFTQADINIRDVISTDPVRSFISRFMLQPKQSAISKCIIWDVRGLVRARQRQESIYVWGQIYYRDIYNRPWRTRFCYVWEPWHPHGARFVPYEQYNNEDQTPFQ